jgi:hypothetical protein
MVDGAVSVPRTVGTGAIRCDVFGAPSGEEPVQPASASTATHVATKPRNGTAELYVEVVNGGGRISSRCRC